MSHSFHPPAGSEPRRSAPNGHVRRTHCEPLHYVPSAADVDAVIAAARAHPLGLDFLREGALDCVAITFATHAFTVIAAREKIAANRPPIA